MNRVERGVFPGRRGRSRRRRAAAVLALALCLAASEGQASPHCVARPFQFADANRAGSLPHLPSDLRGASGLAARDATGNVHLLVILAEFSDLPHRIEPGRFEDLLFGEERSLADYFDEVSGGRLSVTGDLHGWVELPRTQFYYSQDALGISAYPNNAQRMVEDAVFAAIASGLDLSDFDGDGDGVVDALLVIHSGQGWEWAGRAGNSLEPDPAAIVSHKWVVPNQEFSPGAPRVVEYFTCPELQWVRPQIAPAWTDSISTIGVYCHEFGHILGLPDFYDTETSQNHVGVWELMDFGNWNRLDADDPVAGAPGASPAHPSAWSKMLLGWTEPEVLAPAAGERGQDSFRLVSTSTQGAPLQLLANPGGVDWATGSPGAGEFFLAEVRTRDGYDAGLPAAGLLIYHVDESRRSNSRADNEGEGRLLLLEPRDGQTSIHPVEDVVTEIWPGPAETRFDDLSAPSSSLHDGSASGVSLTDVSPLDFESYVRLTASVLAQRSALPIPFARPNPWSPTAHAGVRLVLSVEDSGEPSGRVLIHDVTGRRIRRLGSADFASEGRLAIWDGLTDAGRPRPAGIYFFRFDGTSGRSGSGRVVLVR